MHLSKSRLKRKEKLRKMKINWFSTFPVYQILRRYKKKRKVEPIEKANETNNNRKPDTYELKESRNEE